MRKFFVRAIPIVTLVLFILVMNSDDFFKKSFYKNNNIPGYIQLVIDEVDNDRWEEAYKKTDELKTAWKNVVKKVQFSAEKDEINSLDMSIERLRGAIITKDKSSAIIELYETYEHWDNIGK